MKFQKRNVEQDPKVEAETSSIPGSASIRRRVHILNEGVVLPFVIAWLEMTLNFLLFPLSIISVIIIQPFVSIIIFFVNIPSRFKLRFSRMTDLNGHESFWLARTNDEQSASTYLKCSNVVVLTLKGNYDINSLKNLLMTRVVDQINPSTKRKMYPRFSQKLSMMTVGRAWVDDKEFDISNHVVEHSDELQSTSQLMQLACNSATLPFLDDRPRWRVYLLPAYPSNMSTMIFSCDPAMADGVYLMHVLHTSIVDEPPNDYVRRHFGAFNQDFDSFRSMFGGIIWFLKNLLRFYDRMDILRVVSPNEAAAMEGTEESEDDQGPKPARTEITITPNEPSTAVLVSTPPSPFPVQNNTGQLPKRKFLVFGPIPLGKLDKVMDVTKATLDELLLATLSASLRDYFYHVHNIRNPIDISACLSVALQGSRKPSSYEEETIQPDARRSETSSDKTNLNESAAQESINYDVRSLIPTSKDDSSFVDSKSPIKLKKHSHSFNNPIPGPSGYRGHLNDQMLSPRTFLLSPNDLNRSSVDKTNRSPPPPPPIEDPRVLFHKPRSFSVGVVPQMSSIPRAFHSQVHSNSSNNADNKFYAKTIESQAKGKHSKPDFTDYYSKAKCSKMTHGPRLSVMKVRLPVNVEGVVPCMWYIKDRMVEQKTESNHMSFYKATKFFNKFLSSRLHRKVMNRLYGQASVAYHSLIGSKNRLSIEGKPIRNIFFWGPLRMAEGLGVSCMTYLDNLTITLNCDEDLVGTENIFDFFQKKLDDMKDLLQFRRIKQQPRTDTILVSGRKLSFSEGLVDDDTGEEVELRLRRSGRIKASFSSMRRNSMLVLNSLSGTPRPNPSSVFTPNL